MNCAIAIDRPAPAWIRILQSIGACFEVIDLCETNSAMRYPVWIITQRNPDRELCERIRKFEKEGGRVLIGATAASKTWNISCKRFYSSFLLPDGHLLCNEILDLRQTILISSKANSLHDLQGRPVVYLPKDKDLNAAIIPDNFVEQIFSRNFAHRYFYGNGGVYYPMELVSLISKGALRRLIHNLLRALFHFLDLPFIHSSYLPLSANALFCFRLDTDYSDEHSLMKFYQSLEEYHFKATWFIETRTAISFLSLFRQMEGHEAAYHCHRHRTFDHYKKNENDFQTGIGLLHQAGIEPKGYAAPQGVWTPVLADTIAAFGFEYSSEFTWAYDDVPHYPTHNETFYPTLQVPIHPISVGRLLQARYTDQQITDYYLQWIHRAIPRYEPICLYDHPAHQRAECWKPVFRELSLGCAQNMTFLEFARWWKGRQQDRFRASFRNGVLSVVTLNTNPQTALAVEFPDHSYYHLPMSTVNWTKDQLQPYLQTPSFSAGIIPSELLKRTAQKDLRLFYNEWLFRFRRMKQ